MEPLFPSMHPSFDEILPHPAGVGVADALIHERSYVVRSYRKGTDTMVLRGAVRDQKPPGLYIVDDPEPLTVHHMIVDLAVAVPSLEITAVDVALETHPHTNCPRIEDHYGHLVGLSIARGFTHKVRELFGGPRGCTHTTALLQAMAPVAVQSLWSFQMAAAHAAGEASPFADPEQRMRSVMMNLNTCHVWAEDGEQVTSIRNGEPMEVPVWIQDRFAKLGRNPATWRSND
jgi:hypothetical protein